MVPGSLSPTDPRHPGEGGCWIWESWWSFSGAIQISWRWESSELKKGSPFKSTQKNCFSFVAVYFRISPPPKKKKTMLVIWCFVLHFGQISRLDFFQVEYIVFFPSFHPLSPWAHMDVFCGWISLEVTWNIRIWWRVSTSPCWTKFEQNWINRRRWKRFRALLRNRRYSPPGSSNIAVNGEKWGSRIEDVFPIKNGDIPASYVSLPEGRCLIFSTPANVIRFFFGL